NSTSEILAATPKAVKAAYDLANGKQPADATLTALAGLATAADRLPYFTGADRAALATLTAIGRAIIAKGSIKDVLNYQRLSLKSSPHYLSTLTTQKGVFLMLIGYIRVSTNDQNTDLQRNALMCAGCEQIFEDKMSGTKSERPGLKRALKCLKRGDTLVVWKLDRLGRRMKHLIALTEELRAKGVNFRSLTDSIDTSTPMGRFFFHMMGALAEMERELIVERTLAGLAAARAQGRVGGRRPKLTKEQHEQIARLLQKGYDRKRLAIIYDIGLSTIYRYHPVGTVITQPEM
ncbi:hypothetical protein E2M49_19245, partial [Salmonella enterica subsp. enterica serovar Frintrop]|nr:hypothetical protein [Salmonella enterica subsp. enterica serovar Frintrop]